MVLHLEIVLKNLDDIFDKLRFKEKILSELSGLKQYVCCVRRTVCLLREKQSNLERQMLASVCILFNIIISKEPVT